jgi:hypothetical protein
MFNAFMNFINLSGEPDVIEEDPFANPGRE